MALKVEIASVQEPDYVGFLGRKKMLPDRLFFSKHTMRGFLGFLDTFGELSSSTNQVDVFLEANVKILCRGIIRRFWFHMGCTGFKSGDVWIFLDFFCGVNEMYAVNIFWGGTGRTSEIIGFLFTLWLTVAS